MLDGVNDDPDQAVVLSEVLKPHEAFKVNLIPFNPTPGEFTGSLAGGDRRLPRHPDRTGASRPRSASPAAATSTPPAASWRPGEAA